MKINGHHYRTIWPAADGRTVEIIDQTRLPHHFEIVNLKNVADAAFAISGMLVRGAPLIGATAAYGICLALLHDASDTALESAVIQLKATRPTAINLRWALDEMMAVVRGLPVGERVDAAYRRAGEIADDDVAACSRIGDYGAAILRDMSAQKNGATVNVLTHCNAGWLATVDWGTALAPIYKVHDAGIAVHVWVDETRPRNQGAALTAYELGAHGVPHTIIVDNAGGHLMQHGRVDVCIVGTDRTTASGDVANKVGTYLKALAAYDNGVPFYVGLPFSSIDWTIDDGIKQVPIEERSGTEVTRISGRADDGRVLEVDIAAPGSPALNIAFDVTPARLVTGLITDRGIAEASKAGLLSLFPEKTS